MVMDTPVAKYTKAMSKSQPHWARLNVNIWVFAPYMIKPAIQDINMRIGTDIMLYVTMRTV